MALRVHVHTYWWETSDLDLKAASAFQGVRADPQGLPHHHLAWHCCEALYCCPNNCSGPILLADPRCHQQHSTYHFCGNMQSSVSHLLPYSLHGLLDLTSCLWDIAQVQHLRTKRMQQHMGMQSCKQVHNMLEVDNFRLSSCVLVRQCY